MTDKVKRLTHEGDPAVLGLAPCYDISGEELIVSPEHLSDHQWSMRRILALPWTSAGEELAVGASVDISPAVIPRRTSAQSSL